MLLELRIRDFAIIDELELRFAPGFSVLTGETGAGKSIIVDAVELVLGEWADSTVVRSGAERAIVEAVFRLGPEQRAAIYPLLEREGLEGDQADLLLGREVRLSRRNICRVNGRSVTLALLREVTEGLVDIHGQSEHLSLLRVREHVDLLDRYAEVWPLREQISETVGQVQAAREEVAALRRDEQELARRADLLQFQINEIEAAALQAGEEAPLRAERPRLANAERLTALMNEAICVVDEAERKAPSALDLLGAALGAVEESARLDPSLESVLEDMESVNAQLEEVARRLRGYRDQIEYSPQRLAEVEERLILIRRLERKYGSTVPEVLARAREMARELDGISHSEERLAELEAEEKRLLRKLGELGGELSRRRCDAAQQLAVAVEKELADLHMEEARFAVGFQWTEDTRGVPLPQPVSSLRFRVSRSGLEQPETGDLGPGSCSRLAFDSSGIDRVEFLVSPNRGEPLRPLVKTASGGETTRLMLALKAVLSRADETPTLVFDEIDQGIGGRVGATVGEKLWGLTKKAGRAEFRHQVLCVTHLPQLAGFGDAHFRVQKVGTGERTVTRITDLEGRARVEELAQMLGGGGEAAYRTAKGILGHVRERKARRETEAKEQE